MRYSWISGQILNNYEHHAGGWEWKYKDLWTLYLTCKLQFEIRIMAWAQLNFSEVSLRPGWKCESKFELITIWDWYEVCNTLNWVLFFRSTMTLSLWILSVLNHRIREIYILHIRPLGFEIWLSRFSKFLSYKTCFVHTFKIGVELTYKCRFKPEFLKATFHPISKNW